MGSGLWARGGAENRKDLVERWKGLVEVDWALLKAENDGKMKLETVGCALLKFELQENLKDVNVPYC